MKKLFIFLLITCLFSCTKDKKSCYECDITPEHTGVYTYVGCYTDEEWRTGGVQTDAIGNPIDQGTRCRTVNR